MRKAARLLLDHGHAAAALQNRHSQTPPHYAAKHGRMGVVPLLGGERGGGGATSCCCRGLREHRHSAAVQRLLDSNVAAGSAGRYALAACSRGPPPRGLDEVVRLLLLD
jgi:ankyrin repeat protein